MDKPATSFNREGLESFFIPLHRDQITLREAYGELAAVGNPQQDVPWIVRLAEHPDYHFDGFGLFKGRVTLRHHDFIHIILGRGLLLMDEAFVIGFTMGSSNRVSTTECDLFNLIASTFYPKPYRFTDAGKQVFKDAVHLGYVSDCTPLDTVDFEPMLDMSLRDIRLGINLETDLLEAYYRIEARRYPKYTASQRLLRPD